MSNAKHTLGPWTVSEWQQGSPEADSCCGFSIVAGGHRLPLSDMEGDISEAEANASLIAAAPDYHDAAFWIQQAVANNAAPVNPIAALEEMALAGEHITLDAGLVLDLLKAHAKATGSAA